MKLKTRKLITAGATFTVALGIGTVMQYGDALAARIGVDPQPAPPVAMTTAVQPIAVVAAFDRNVPDLSPVARVPAADTGTAGLALPRDTAGPTLVPPSAGPTLALATPGLETPQADDAAAAPVLRRVTITTPQPDGATDGRPAAQACGTRMTADPQPLAFVQITLTDACRSGSVVTIHHQGMMFQGVTDAAGRFTAMVPALSRDALFVADFAQGPGAAATATVPDLDQVDRAVLQWQGQADVQLHALEFGASYYGTGHVWAGSPGTADAARSGTGGVLTRLGNADLSDGLMAEVYTFPSGTSRRDGAVILSVEAEVSSGNCGREVSAQSIQLHPGSPADAVDLVMTMPGCEATGEFLVLKNMFEDLTLAAR